MNVSFANNMKKTTAKVRAGKIDNNQLQSALNMQQEQDTYIGLIFKKLGYIDENELQEGLLNDFTVEDND